MRYRVTTLVVYFDEENNVTSSHNHSFNFDDIAQARDCYENYVFDAIDLHTIDPDDCDWKVSLYDHEKDDYICYTKSRYYGKFI